MSTKSFRVAITLFIFVILTQQSIFGQAINFQFRDTSRLVNSFVNIPVRSNTTFTSRGVIAYNLQYTFNPSVLSAAGVVTTGTISNAFGAPTVNTAIPGKITISGAGTGGTGSVLTGLGNFIFLRFQVVGNGTTSITNTGTQFNYLNEGNPILNYVNSCTFTAIPLPVITVNPSVPLLLRNQAQQFNASGGTAPYSWSLTNPSIGTVSAAGLLTPTQLGITSVKATDANTYTGLSTPVEVRGYRLSIPDSSSSFNSFIDIPVRTTNLSGLAVSSGTINLSYTPGTVTQLSVVTAGSLLSGNTPLVNFATPGLINVSFAQSTAISGAGVLFWIRCRLSSTAPGVCGFTINETSTLNEDLRPIITSGSVSFPGAPLLTLSPSSGQLVFGDSLLLTVSGAIQSPLTYTVSNPSLAFVTANRYLKVLGSGNVTVTATDAVGAFVTSGVFQLFDTRLFTNNVVASAGTIVDIPVRVSALPAGQSILSLQGNLVSSNTSVFSIQQIITSGTPSSGFSVSSSPISGGLLFAMAGTSGISGNSELFRIRVLINPSALASSSGVISFNNILLNEGTPLPIIQSGSVTVGTCVLPPIPTISAGGPLTFCSGGSVTLTSSSATGNVWSTAETTQSIVVTTPGAYTVTAGTVGCSQTSTPTNVIVNPIPTITGTTPGTSCNSGAVLLGASSSAGTISWFAASSGGAALSTGTGYTTPVISGTTNYWVSTTSNGCTSSPRVSVTATILPPFSSGSLVSGNQVFTGSGVPANIAFATAPTGGAGTYSYQWYSQAGIIAAPTGTATTGWTLITGATAVSYDPGVQSASISYAVQVNPTGTPDCGAATWAAGVRQITVNATAFTPGILTAGNVNLCNPADPANITFSTAATAGSTYQWYFQDGIIAAPAATAALTGWTSIASATLATYDAPSGLTASRTYACRVNNVANSQWASGVTQITVLPVVNFGTLAAGNQVFTASGDPSIISFGAGTAPIGGAGTYSYQWYSQAGIIAAPSGTAITGWTLLTGATTASYDPGVQSASISYAVQVNPTGTPDCGVATWASGVRQITVNATAFTSGILTAGNVNLCNPADPANITFSTAATAGSTYQWYFQDGIIVAPAATAALTGWTSIASATLATYDAPAGLTASRTYACRVTNSTVTVSQWASGVTQITVLPVVNFGTLAAGNQVFTASGDPSIISFGTGTAPSGGAGTFTYTWYSASGIQPAPTGTTIPVGWTPISGQTASSYDPGVQSASISYAVQVNPTGTPDCGNATWAAGVRQITVNATAFTPGILTAGNVNLCNPADPANITFSTAATAGSTFQWYFQDGIITAPAATAALTGWTSIASATLATYDAPAGLTASRTYACRVTNGANSQWASGVRQISVLPVFNPGSLIANQTGCNAYDPVSITMATNPVGSGAYNWRWYYWENTTQVCPTGSTVPAGAVTSTTDIRFFGTSTSGSGIFFDPTSPGTNGRTWALLITPAANGASPACGVAQFTTTCHKTIRQVCRIGQGEESIDQGFIDTPFLGQSYPNPNQGKFNIEYFLPTDCKGEIVIYDITGKKLAQSDCETGRRQTLEFDVQHLSQGTYYYSLECNGLKMETRKMVLVK